MFSETIQILKPASDNSFKNVYLYFKQLILSNPNVFNLFGIAP